MRQELQASMDGETWETLDSIEGDDEIGMVLNPDAPYRYSRTVVYDDDGNVESICTKEHK